MALYMANHSLTAVAPFGRHAWDAATNAYEKLLGGLTVLTSN
jgi:hypothetical protein